MKLKTLKDCAPFIVVKDTKGEEVPHISLEQLKAEAVKWVKEIEKDKDEYTGDVVYWIINFFNLTEEDLGEKQNERKNTS